MLCLIPHHLCGLGAVHNNLYTPMEINEGSGDYSILGAITYHVVITQSRTYGLRMIGEGFNKFCKSLN